MISFFVRTDQFSSHIIFDVETLTQVLRRAPGVIIIPYRRARTNMANVEREIRVGSTLQARPPIRSRYAKSSTLPDLFD